MNKFWIVLPLSRKLNTYVQPDRHDSLEAASAAAIALATNRPTDEGYAVMECVLITEKPEVTVELVEPTESSVNLAAKKAFAESLRAKTLGQTPVEQQLETGQAREKLEEQKLSEKSEPV